MYEVDTSHWHEPKAFKNAGYGAWKRLNTPYGDDMEAQGSPIPRATGVTGSDVVGALYATPADGIARAKSIFAP